MLSQQTGKPIRPSSVLLLSELLPRPGASAPSVSAVRRCPSPADSFPVATGASKLSNTRDSRRTSHRTISGSENTKQREEFYDEMAGCFCFHNSLWAVRQ